MENLHKRNIHTSSAPVYFKYKGVHYNGTSNSFQVHSCQNSELESPQIRVHNFVCNSTSPHGCGLCSEKPSQPGLV